MNKSRRRKYMKQISREGIIGEAWFGKHVITLLCDPIQQQIISYDANQGAPLEPIAKNCAETLSRLLSIGYKIQNSTPIFPNQVYFVLVK
jgi:hypothetical protein